MPISLNLPAFGTPNWDVLLNQNFQTLQSSVLSVGTFDATGQGAAISGQPLTTVSPARMVRVTAYAVVTRAATTSSSINVSVSYTDADSGVVTTLSGTAQVGNTVGAICSAVFVCSLANLGALTGSTTYASVGGTSMQYAVHFRCEII